MQQQRSLQYGYLKRSTSQRVGYFGLDIFFLGLSHNKNNYEFMLGLYAALGHIDVFFLSETIANRFEAWKQPYKVDASQTSLIAFIFRALSLLFVP